MLIQLQLYGLWDKRYSGLCQGMKGTHGQQTTDAD